MGSGLAFAVIAPSDGCRLLSVSTNNGAECQQEQAGNHEGVVEYAGAHEEVGYEVDRANKINDRPKHHKLRLKGDEKFVDHAELTPAEAFGFRVVAASKKPSRSGTSPTLQMLQEKYAIEDPAGYRPSS